MVVFGRTAKPNKGHPMCAWDPRSVPEVLWGHGPRPRRPFPDSRYPLGVGAAKIGYDGVGEGISDYTPGKGSPRKKGETPRGHPLCVWDGRSVPAVLVGGGGGPVRVPDGPSVTVGTLMGPGGEKGARRSCRVNLGSQDKGKGPPEERRNPTRGRYPLFGWDHILSLRC